MKILNAADVRQALPMRAAIDAVKRAYAALSDGRAEVPLRTPLKVAPHDGLALFMPAFVNDSAGEAMAVKIVTLFDKNPARGLPFIHAAVLVMDPQTGKMLAVLEGGTLTAIRTGAASGASTEILAREDSSVAAIFGAGVQARTQLEAVCTVRKIEEVWIFDADNARAQAMAAEVAGKGPIPGNVKVAANPQQAVENADVVCTATTSSKPVFEDNHLKTGAHVSGVGSYTPQMAEVPVETVQRARVVVDSRSATLAEAGDLIQPIHAGVWNPDQIHAELGEIVLGRKSGRQSANEITFFKSVGLAAQDAAAAQTALAFAAEHELGQEIVF
jgi:ornithine cyclodeaminase